MCRNKYYVILGILVAATLSFQAVFAQTDQIPVLKEYSKRGESAKAIKLAQEILQSDPNNFTALDILTGVYINMGNLIAAEENAKKVLTLQPTDPVAHQLLARIYRIKAGKDPKSTTNNLTLALEYAQKGLVSNPNDVMLLAEEAQIYSARGHKTKAEQAISRALAINPDNNYLKMIKEKISASKRIEEKEATE